MILECASCAKMYRIRDDASPQPTKCPTCNGDLRAAGGAAPGGAGSRVKELETRIQSLERELAESRSGRPTLSVETSPGFSGFSAPVAELRSAAEKSDRLERELLALRSDVERKLKDKDREIVQARETAEREAAERRKQESRGSGLEETHARALEGKEKTIEALDASIASYRSKLEAAQKKLDAVEIQRLNDLNAFDSRIRQKEESDRVSLDRTTEMQQQALTALRVEMEVKIQEKDRLISEGRQALDREAGERRRLSEELNRLQENVAREVAEKTAAGNALEATLASYKSKIDTLQKRVDSLEGLRRSEHDHLSRQVRVSQAIRSRVDEAGHLATDLDHSLDSIEASIATLRDRSRRLKASLEIGEAETSAPLAPLAPSYAPPAEPEAEPVRPALSQADWGSPAPAPSVAPEAETQAEPEPEAAPIEEAPAEEAVPLDRFELPHFSEVTKTKIKPAPPREPDPDPGAEPAILEKRPDIEPELELAPDGSQGRVKEPTGVFPIVEAEPAPTAAADESSDIPLISPPEDEKPAPPPPTKKDDTKRKFSWQRK
jgi:chromosome segregation ATPase